MPSFNPTAQVARCVENVLYYAKDTDNLGKAVGFELLSRSISLTILPIALLVELVFKRVPKAAYSIAFSCCEVDDIKRRSRIAKVEKFVLGTFLFPLGLASADCVSGLFLKKISRPAGVYPFGVEEAYGRSANVRSPKNQDELKQIVQVASKGKKQVSVVGSGMSQGEQTVPGSADGVVINMRQFRDIEFSGDNSTVKVGVGLNWEEVQIAANQRGKSVIVKQASDVFSIGGSIGINCHGWAHEVGSLSKVITQIEVLNANGGIEVLNRDDEEFKLYFGTLGYFGIVVSATLELVDNEEYTEETDEIPVNEFHQYYQEQIKGRGFPLFGGRLNLDQTDGIPLRSVCMEGFKPDPSAPCSSTDPVPPRVMVVTPNFKAEPSFGTRIERIALQAIGHLSRFSARRILSLLWRRERSNMMMGSELTRNEALHPPIKAFNMFKNSQLRTQWLQEYFIKPENLTAFLEFLGQNLKDNNVRLINATIRPTPKDEFSILPYAEQDRYAVVICFSQIKTPREMKKTEAWINRVNEYLLKKGDVYYQPYMPYTTPAQFEAAYGSERVAEMRLLKKVNDPHNLFGNKNTQKYFDAPASV